ncbi:Transmembrane protein 63 [Carabus blaptoides fortunei]
MPDMFGNWYLRLFIQRTNNMEEFTESAFIPTENTCLIKKNTTVIITTAYEGIPETLVLNLIAWSILLVLFTILRNRAWDYGRLALVQSEKLMHLFYGNMDDVATIADESSDSLVYRDQGCCSWIPAIFTISKERST